LFDRAKEVITSTAFRFDCVFYYVSDLDRAIDFYAPVLGLRLLSRDAVARFHIDGVLFELVPAQDSAVLEGCAAERPSGDDRAAALGKSRCRPWRLAGGGNARLCLAVDDIDDAAAALTAQGVRVSDVRVVSNGALASFEDPDGNEIAMWQYA